MKQYIENYDGSFQFGLSNIPNTESNRDFRIMQEEIANGDAEIIAYAVDISQLKAEKRNAIDSKTDEMIAAGITHNGVDFKINVEKEIAAIALNSARMAGMNMAGKKFRGKHETYTFASTADFDLWFATAFGRLESVISAGSELKDAVAACTTVEELDSIVDSRT